MNTTISPVWGRWCSQSNTDTCYVWSLSHGEPVTTGYKGVSVRVYPEVFGNRCERTVTKEAGPPLDPGWS